MNHHQPLSCIIEPSCWHHSLVIKSSVIINHNFPSIIISNYQKPSLTSNQLPSGNHQLTTTSHHEPPPFTSPFATIPTEPRPRTITARTVAAAAAVAAAVQAMQLVLFDEAMQHLMKINRNWAMGSKGAHSQGGWGRGN